MDYFSYLDEGSMVNQAFCELFDGPARAPESPITRREMDLAASIQQVTEEVVLGLAREARRRTGLRHLCLAGGVALNCVANGLLLRERIFDGIWIQRRLATRAARGRRAGGVASPAGACRADARTRARRPGKGQLPGAGPSRSPMAPSSSGHDYPYERIEDRRERAERTPARSTRAGGRVLAGAMEFRPGVRWALARSWVDPRRSDTQG